MSRRALLARILKTMMFWALLFYVAAFLMLIVFFAGAAKLNRNWEQRSFDPMQKPVKTEDEHRRAA